LVWKPGTSGNPAGMKLLSDDLRRLLTQNPDRVRKVTEKLVSLAEEGDLTAIQMLMDRMEGKPTQSIEIDQTVTQLPREQRFARLLEIQAKVIPSVTAQPVASAAPRVSPVKQITSGNGDGSGN
jgi:hypothetical protein